MSHPVYPMIIMFKLCDATGFKPTGGWDPRHQFNTSLHIEVKKYKLFKGCF
jgi:hypothetical protein